MNNKQAPTDDKVPKQCKPPLKLTTNDETWGAHNPKPVILISEKVDRHLQQRTPNELETKMMGEWLNK